MLIDTSQGKAGAKPAEQLERMSDGVADDPNPEIVDTGSDEPRRRDEPRPQREQEKPVDARTQRLHDIAKRVKDKRSEEGGPEATGDFTDPAQSYGNYGRQTDDADGDEQSRAEHERAEVDADGDEPAPRKLKLKVNRGEVELTEAEVIALAQKNLAADDYLAQAKDILDRAKTAAAPVPTARQPNQAGAEPADGSEGLDGDNPNQDQLLDLVREIQLGDPEDVAPKLGRYLQQVTGQATQEQTIRSRIADDVRQTHTEYQAFTSDPANQDIVKDKFAAAVIEKGIVEGYVEDLRKIGVSDAKLPRTPNELADAHRFYRSQGYQVRSTSQLLDKVATDYRAWRGTTSAQPARTTQPRIEVDRTARRQTISTQPSRSSTPQRPAQQTPQPRTRSARIAEMRADRNRPRGL